MDSKSSDFVTHTPCPACPSSDGFALYDDGHGYCFVCGYFENDVDEPVERSELKVKHELIGGESKGLDKRCINQVTVKKWDYQTGRFNDKPVQIANYKDAHGTVIAQKLRFPNKDFMFIGDTKNVSLYGQWLWRDKGKRIIICEGEVDALSMSQALNNKWPVVSVAHGAQGAKKDIQKNLEWLCGYDSVVLLFDNDDAGRKASQECAALFPPNKCKIATLTDCKDPNEMIQKGRSKELVDLTFEAKDFRPDGIVNGQELWDVVTSTDNTQSYEYPYKGMNAKTMGIRRGEIVTVTAGSGIGKSQLCREFAHYLLQQGETIGYIALEESVKRTSLGLMSIALNKPLHFGDSDVTKAELKEAFDATMGTGRVYLYDHWGSTDSENLLSKIRYLAKGCECGFIVLDHISIVVSGIGEGDERRLIDNTMTKLRALVEELKVGIILVSHLRRPDGNKGHEEGQRTTLSQLRGSAGIGQLSDIVLGCERNQQDPEMSNLTVVRVLKNRWTGETGVACLLEYDKHTGRMNEIAMPDDLEADGEVSFQPLNNKDEF